MSAAKKIDRQARAGRSYKKDATKGGTPRRYATSRVNTAGGRWLPSGSNSMATGARVSTRRLPVLTRYRLPVFIQRPPFAVIGILPQKAQEAQKQTAPTFASSVSSVATSPMGGAQ